jgi:head-tail adaptor
VIRDKYIVIQKPTFVKDAQGGNTQTLSVIFKGWANVHEGSYKQGMEFGLPIGQLPITVKVRKNSVTTTVDNSCLLTYRGRAYNINMIRELDKFTLEIIAVCSVI